MPSLATLLIACAGLLACSCALLKDLLVTRFRADLRPLAEASIIRKRRLERLSRSPADFEARWSAVLADLYEAQVSKWVRWLVRPRDIRLALEAHFASILPQEVASWTFLERASASQENLQVLVQRCLVRLGWTAKTAGLAGDGPLIVFDDRHRALVYCHHAADEAACWSVLGAARAGQREGGAPVFIVANGEVNTAAAVLAGDLGIVLLHGSQLDRIREHLQARTPTAGAERETLDLAA